MRAGLKRGFSVPRAVLDGRDVSIANYAEVKSPEQSEFYAPLKELPATIPADEQAKLRADAVRAIRDHVIPAYAKLLVFFRKDYVPHARTTLAAEALPDGKAFYRQQIREYTTLDLDPEAIHEIGLKEVARIDADMHGAACENPDAESGKQPDQRQRKARGARVAIQGQRRQHAEWQRV